MLARAAWVQSGLRGECSLGCLRHSRVCQGVSVWINSLGRVVAI